MSSPPSLARRLAAEGLGTAFLLAAVVGSGIMGARLAQGSVAVALLANSIATGAALFALITALAPSSGAHFNPVVSLADRLLGRLSVKEWLAFTAVQFLGAIVGVVLANGMFDEPLVRLSTHVRGGPGPWLAEAVATFGLVQIVSLVAHTRPTAVPAAVGAYITAAYWFTSSTSFANPAVTVARTLTDTFAGIRPADAPMFVVVQFVAGALAVALFRWQTGSDQTPSQLGRDLSFPQKRN